MFRKEEVLLLIMVVQIEEGIREGLKIYLGIVVVLLGMFLVKIVKEVVQVEEAIEKIVQIIHFLPTIIRVIKEKVIFLVVVQEDKVELQLIAFFQKGMVEIIIVEIILSQEIIAVITKIHMEGQVQVLPACLIEIKEIIVQVILSVVTITIIQKILLVQTIIAQEILLIITIIVQEILSIITQTTIITIIAQIIPYLTQTTIV